MDKLNKKAVVFTFITVILLFVLIIAFLVNINNRSNTKIQTANVKVETLNSFVKNLNSSLIPDAIRASANQAMISLFDYESNQSTYIVAPDTLEDYFTQTMRDGSYKGVQQDGMYSNGLDFTVGSTLNEIKDLAGQQGAIFTYSSINFGTLTITQEDPWHVKIRLRLSYTLTDVKNEIIWNIVDREIISILNVEDYRDPIYLIQAETKKSINIKKTSYNNFVNINDFNDHVQNIYFRANEDAPNFLERLQGKFIGTSLYGIESVLDPAIYLNGNGYSNVDHLFFTQVPGACVQGMPSNFKLDDSHLNYYDRIRC